MDDGPDSRGGQHQVRSLPQGPSTSAPDRARLPRVREARRGGAAVPQSRALSEGQPAQAAGAEPRPSIFVDPDGVTCVRVPLANSFETATLSKADYDRLKAAGLSSYWYYASNGRGLRYVSAKRPGFGLLRVARLVMEEEEGREVIRYANGDRLDLRRSNLFVAKNPYSYASHAPDELSA